MDLINLVIYYLETETKSFTEALRMAEDFMGYYNYEADLHQNS